MKSVVLFAGAILLTFFAVSEAKVKVSVYYESLCPDSRRFIVNQLTPLVKELGGTTNNYLDVELVPYGKANHTIAGPGDYTFECQHGPQECLGNRVQSCAIKHYPGDKALAFVNCSMYRFSETSGPACAQEVGIDYAPIANCVNSIEGAQALAIHGEKTHALRPSLYYVPWILFEDQFSHDDLADAQTDLNKLLCEKLGEGAHPGCSQYSKVKVTVYYESLCPDSKRFINNQLTPLVNKLGGTNNSYVDVELVPYGKANHTEEANGDWSFECQHGAPECEGNKIQACAIKHYPADKALAFVNCSMAYFNVSSGPTCAQEVGIDYAPIQTCFNSVEGSALLADNGDKTHGLLPKLYYVPWILFQDKFSNADLTEAQADLNKLICEKLGDNKHSECSSAFAASSSFVLAIFSLMVTRIWS